MVTLTGIIISTSKKNIDCNLQFDWLVHLRFEADKAFNCDVIIQ